MRWDDAVTIVHPVTGHVLAEGERANVGRVTGGALLDDISGQMIGSVRELLVMLAPDTAYDKGYVVRWQGVDWTPAGDLLPITRRGRVHHYEVTVKRKAL